MIYDYIIVGAGASGLFAAATLNTKNKIKGLILEQTSRAGTKLLMSGNGQCNITHSGDIKDFTSAYGDNGRKIRSLLYKYNNVSLIEFLESNGIKTEKRQDGKVFPASYDAKEIRDFLVSEAISKNFTFQYNSKVSGLCLEDEIWKVQTVSTGDSCSSATYMGRKVIIATGGCSYHKTGSDGSIFPILEKQLGISIITPKPALCPLKVKDYPFTDLAGISFDAARCSIMHSEKVIASETGGLLLTHKDFSGPSVINISKYAGVGDKLRINYLGMNFDEVLMQLKSGKKLTDMVPRRFEEYLRDAYGNSPKELAKALTGEIFEITSPGDFNRAMATAGGIALKEIDLKTMEFKSWPGLYAVGEALDIDGKTGGYNLQFAYSSAICSTK